MIGHNRSPKETPNTSEKPDFKPPETVRAIIATQTGPGVRNSITSAPQYSTI